MKNKKFVLGVCLCFLLVLGACIFLFIPQNSKENEKKPKKKNEPKEEVIDIFKFMNKDIDLSNISSLEIINYTEGGDLHTDVDIDDIESYYLRLKKVIVKEETDITCDDNTTVYSFHMKDNNDIAIEFECGHLVYNNKRYVVE